MDGSELKQKNLRVVEVLGNGGETLLCRRDCYDRRDGEGVWQIEEEAVHVRTVSWINAPEGTAEVRWEEAASPLSHVTHLRIYDWQTRDLMAEHALHDVP